MGFGSKGGTDVTFESFETRGLMLDGTRIAI